MLQIMAGLDMCDSVFVASDQPRRGIVGMLAFIGRMRRQPPPARVARTRKSAKRE
jgi:hypothetical protein